MGGVIFFDMVYALGVAISPTPVILVLLILYGVRGHWNGLGYLIGWMLGLVILGVIVFFLVAAGVFFLSAGTGVVRPFVLVLVGIGLLWIAYRQWTKPLDPQLDLAEPKWLATAERMILSGSGHLTPMRTFALALVMSTLSPKNIALTFAAVLAFSQAELSAQDVVLLYALFILISSLTIGIPVAYALLKRDRAAESINQWKIWVLRNSPRAVALILAAIAIILVLNGLGGMSMNLQAGTT